MSVTAASVASVLTKAADLIEEKGWTQHDYYAGGCFCADGALQVASGYAFVNEEADDIDYDYDLIEADNFAPRAIYTEAYRAACKAAGKTNYGLPSIIGLNDDEDTTASDVIAVLRSAVELVAD